MDFLISYVAQNPALTTITLLFTVSHFKLKNEINNTEEKHKYEISLMREQFVKKESVNKMINSFKHALDNQTKMIHSEFSKLRETINDVNVKVEKQKIKIENLGK